MGGTASGGQWRFLLSEQKIVHLITQILMCMTLVPLLSLLPTGLLVVGVCGESVECRGCCSQSMGDVARITHANADVAAEAVCEDATPLAQRCICQSWTAVGKLVKRISGRPESLSKCGSFRERERDWLVIPV